MELLDTFCQGYRDLFRDARLFDGFTATLTGILASGSTRLSQIARAAPQTAPTPHAERRLRRLVHGQNSRSSLTADVLGERLTQRGASQLAGLAEVVVVMDGSDLRKPHAHDLKSLSSVRSLGEGFVPGYHTLNAIGLTQDGRRVLLYHHLYSPLAPGFKSENTEVQTAVTTLARALHGVGVGRVIFVLDRGFDSEALIRHIESLNCGFLIRAQHLERTVRSRPRSPSGPLLDLLGTAPVLAQLELRRPEDKDGQVKWRKGQARVRGQAVVFAGHSAKAYLEVNALKVEFPGRGRREAVVDEAQPKADGVGAKALKDKAKTRTTQEPGWVLLTNLPVEGAGEAAWVVKLYLGRWSVEEVFAWTKGALGWEQVQVLDFEAVRTLVALAWTAAAFAFDLGGKLEEPEIRLLAHLGGYVPHKGRPPGKKILLKGLERLASGLVVHRRMGAGGGEAGGGQELEALVHAVFGKR